MLTERYQQQVEHGQRQTHQQILHGVQWETAQYFKQKKGGKGEANNQIAVFQCAFAGQQSGHRLHQPYPQRLVSVTAGAITAGTENGAGRCQAIGAPLAAEAFRVNLSFHGQYQPLKTRVRPVRTQTNAGFLGQRQCCQGFGAVQV